MPIVVACSCRKTLRVKEEYAGGKVRCPHCQSVVQVPEAEVVELVELEEVPEEISSDPSESHVAEKPILKRRQSFRGEKDEEENEDDYKPKRRRKRRNRTQEWFINYQALVTGILCMFGAVIWFCAGLVFQDYLYYYPPFLFLAGIFGVVKGLRGDHN